MKCPNCNTEMVNGYYMFKSDLVKQVMIGPSTKDLYFISNEYNDQMILKHNSKKEGFFCNNCFTNVIMNNESGNNVDPKITI